MLRTAIRSCDKTVAIVITATPNAVVSVTEALPVALVPEENTVSSVRLDVIHIGRLDVAAFSDEFNALCIPFEDSLSEEQIDVFYRILDCVSETASPEMRAAYKFGFKDGVTMMQEIQD